MDRELLKELRATYPAGTRVELLSMDDSYRSMEPGLQGTVKAVDDIGTIHIAWDNGCSLGVVYGVDRIRKL